MRTAAFLLLAALPLLAADPKTPPPKDAPRILYSSPLAVPPGFAGKLTLRGVKLDRVKTVSAAPAGVTVQLRGEGRGVGVPANHPKDRAGDTELTVELTLPKGLAADTVELTAAGPGGTTAAYRLTVAADTAEKEPNNGFATAQELAVPAAVVGRIARETDVDVYRVVGRPGRRLRVEVWAARLGSPLDPLLSVSDARRRPLATADDAPDGGLDPAAVVTLPADGVAFVVVQDAHDVGSEHYGYRLVVSEGE